MTKIHAQPQAAFNRRTFGAVAGAAALTAVALPRAHSEPPATIAGSAAGAKLKTGNGAWTYEVVSDWGQLPTGESFGGTHGAIGFHFDEEPIFLLRSLLHGCV